MNMYTEEELESIQKNLYKIKDIMKDMKKGDVIDFKAAKAKKEKGKAKEIAEDHRSSDLGDRHKRIQASMEKIDSLMAELKSMSKDKEDKTEKDEMSGQPTTEDHIAQLTRMRDHLLKIKEHMSKLKEKAAPNEMKKPDK